MPRKLSEIYFLQIYIDVGIIVISYAHVIFW